jgi:hypothetical protein
MKFYRQSARFTARLAMLGVALLAAAWPARGTSPTPVPTPAWRVAVVGFQRPAGVWTTRISGAQFTELAAACPGEKGAFRYLTREEFAALGVDWATFQAGAAPAAAALLAKVTPEWIRDGNQVIDCAILRGARPDEDITPVILTPGFLKRFTPVFGRKFLIAIPERGTVFLFPLLASRYQDYAERVLSVYHKSKNPVSREVLELGPGGLRAIGAYAEQQENSEEDFSLRPGLGLNRIP